MNTMWIISEFRNGKQSKLTNYLIAGVIMTIEEITNKILYELKKYGLQRRSSRFDHHFKSHAKIWPRGHKT